MNNGQRGQYAKLVTEVLDKKKDDDGDEWRSRHDYLDITIMEKTRVVKGLATDILTPICTEWGIDLDIRFSAKHKGKIDQMSKEHAEKVKKWNRKIGDEKINLVAAIWACEDIEDAKHILQSAQHFGEEE